jgi:uncharacterized protein YbbC (DUF1343 family)
MMQRLFFALAIFGWLGSGVAVAAVELGIDVLRSRDFDLLRGKRVGLITNQTGVDRRGTHTRVILKKALGGNLVALFSPEHGIDGVALAGVHVPSRKDAITGLPVHSLYGPTRKPTAAMLRGIDVLVFDMQDIGARSYTYISTMALCMEAAGEQGLEFVVLDRPNPLGGLRVEGPPIEARWQSFVGIFPIPYVHGMTVGELAQQANARGWTKARCRLAVVPMRGWRRGMTWGDTGLRWVRTSPNIPRASSAYYYVVTGIVGSLKGVSVGTGGPTPFQYLQSPGLPAEAAAARIRAVGYPGVEIAGRGNRIDLEISPKAQADLCQLAVHLLIEADRAAKPSLFARYRDPHAIFWKVYGSTSIQAKSRQGESAQRIAASWRGHLASFRSARKPYLLYP